MKRRILGLVLVVGGVAVVLGVGFSLVPRSQQSDSDEVAMVEDALRTPPTTTSLPPTTSPEIRRGETQEPTTTSASVAIEGITPADTSFKNTVASAISSPPVRITIEALGIDAPIGAYGVDRGTGQMAVPDNVTDVAWYKYGPSPGAGGSAVLAAHVDLAGQGPGVFFALDELVDDDVITVTYADDSQRSYRVVVTTQYDKDEIPLDVIFSRSGPPVLTLVTCGGGFSRSTRTYDSNVVVYAVPISEPLVGSIG